MAITCCTRHVNKRLMCTLGSLAGAVFGCCFLVSTAFSISPPIRAAMDSEQYVSKIRDFADNGDLTDFGRLGDLLRTSFEPLLENEVLGLNGKVAGYRRNINLGAHHPEVSDTPYEYSIFTSSDRVTTESDLVITLNPAVLCVTQENVVQAFGSAQYSITTQRSTEFLSYMGNNELNVSFGFKDRYACASRFIMHQMIKG